MSTKTPGQVAYEAWQYGMNEAGYNYPAWEILVPAEHASWEAAAAAVMAARDDAARVEIDRLQTLCESALDQRDHAAQKLATSEAILSHIGSLLDEAGVPDGGGLETRVRMLIERKHSTGE